MLTAIILLFALLAAGAGALAVRAAFRILRWLIRTVRFLLGASLLAALVYACFPGLSARIRSLFDGAGE